MKFKFILLVTALGLQACSTNPATGKQQFTALMPPSQENQVGAQEHAKIIEQFGLYDNQAVASYVQKVGSKVTQRTERPDVQYKFFVIDSPIVNAFALPGGYIYISRGLLALANNEAQLAAVLSHEAGHITGRHSAERYSRGVVTSLGAGLIGAAIGSAQASQALGTGANLFMSAYSRDQENEADSLGLRYMTQGGYDPDEMSSFLSSLQAQSGLESRLAGKESNAASSYFSTHPATGDRVRKTLAEGKAFADSDIKNREIYLNTINGITYGDSAKQGFTRGTSFYHPVLGFTFTAPEGYRIVNQPTQVLATASNGSVLLFDVAKRASGQSAANYIAQNWIKKEGLNIEPMTINGMNAATASFPGTVNNTPVTLRVVAIEWQSGQFARFQVAIPNGLGSRELDALKTATYSFRNLGASEKQSLKPYRLVVVTAGANDTMASLARRLPYEDQQEERFRVLNGLLPNEALIAGRQYKIITE